MAEIIPFNVGALPFPVVVEDHCDGRNDSFHLGIGDSDRTRKTEAVTVEPLCHRAVCRVRSVMGGGEMHRLPERPGLDASLFHVSQERSTIHTCLFFIHEDAV